MASPEPTSGMLEARETMRSRAVPIVTDRLRVRPEMLGERATGLAGHLLAQSGALDREQAGWSLLGTASILARQAEELVAGIGGNEEDLASGVMWAAVVVGVAGNGLIDLASDPPGTKIAKSSVDDEGLRRSAQLLVDEMLGAALGSPTSGAAFGEGAVRILFEGLPGIDRDGAGRTLQAVGVWCAHEDETLAPSPRRAGPLRGRRADAGIVRLGCALAGALIASVGLASRR